MAVDRTERLLNLVFCLMAARRAVGRGEIQRTIPGYSTDQSPAAFERMFERDKDELRSMGIPIETVVDANGEVEGYRILADEYALPPVSLDADEAAVLALAAQVWDEAVLAPEAVTALRKLEAASGAPASAPAAGHTLVRHGAADATILTLMAGVRERRVVRFTYTTADGRHGERVVDPWGVLARGGAWYLIGRDHERDAMRAFRVSRMEEPVRLTRTAAATERPQDLDLATALEGDSGPGITARIAVRAGHGAALRRLAASGGEDPHADAELTFSGVSERRLVEEACAAGEGAVVLEPPSLVTAVRARLEATSAAHR